MSIVNSNLPQASVCQCATYPEDCGAHNGGKTMGDYETTWRVVDGTVIDPTSDGQGWPLGPALPDMTDADGGRTVEEIEKFMAARPFYNREHVEEIAAFNAQEGTPFHAECADWHLPEEECSL